MNSKLSRRHSRFLLSGVVLAAAVLSAARAATPGPGTAAVADSSASPGASTAHKLEAGEKISVSVIQAPELNATRTVDSKGKVDLIWVNEVALAGLTIPQAQDAIRKAYIDGFFLRNPEVKINLEQQNIKYVNVTGQIKGSDTRVAMPPDQPMTLSQAVLKAGGFNEMAKGSAVTITRRQGEGKKAETLGPFDVESMIKGRKVKTDDPVLQPDDIIYVPASFI